jgi:site-specific recombinase XerD
MLGYLESEMAKVEEGMIGVVVYRLQRKAASLLADCMHGRALVLQRKSYVKHELCEHYEMILERYAAHLSNCVSPGTTVQRVQHARRFFAFLEECGIKDLCELRSENVKEYITMALPNYSAGVLSLTKPLKNVLLYLNDSGLTSINAERYLVNPAPSRKKVLPCFTDDEAEAILNCVDRATALGKRDYAVMKTALWTGLRGVDIFGLKKSDIDWNRKVISLTQDKTEVLFQTELSHGVGNAIADYILNGRPDTTSQYIFVSHVVPHAQMKGGGANVIRRYLESAGISHEAGDGKSFHAFRRTMGTRLVRAGIPIRSVSEMLGQLKTDSAKRYVALDNHGLSECCMDISAFGTGKEGLS